ncbi:MAG: amidohydrolase family protein [Acidobacteria bacterium]|nr:amidohydrolase family protein [Acidobacteriota bacterium]
MNGQERTSAFCSILTALVLILFATQMQLFALQISEEVGRRGYADTIFVNGKIVSMDDKSTSTDVGKIYRALAVKGDRIVKLGTAEEVKTLAGPQTKIFDLRGRTMIPGIVETHNHFYGGIPRYLQRMGIKYPPSGIRVSAQAERDLEKTQAVIREAIQGAVKKVRPGEWVVLDLDSHPAAPDELQLWGRTWRLTDRKTLDMWAPNNPVLLSPGARGVINGKALEVLEKRFPGYTATIQETMAVNDLARNEDIAGRGWVGSQEMGTISGELFLDDINLPTVAEALRMASEDFASYGITTISTRIPLPKVLSGFSTLARIGKMPIRLAGHYEIARTPSEPRITRNIYAITGVLEGLGNDYFWLDGAGWERWDSGYPESCTGPDTVAPAHIKARELCPKPGDLNWDTLQNAIKYGWRVVGTHMCGSEAARSYMRMIEGARIAKGWSMEDIRRLQITGEHCDLLGKDPELLKQLKEYGIFLSCGIDRINMVESWVRDYGPQIEKFVAPLKSYIESGVKICGQHFGSGAGSTGVRLKPPFFLPWQAITRKYHGKVWQPEERIDRVHALKMWTIWSADYVQRQDRIGSIELEKFADLVILDRDYFTIPVDDILKIKPLMTMIGGKMVVLQESLAKDFGVPQVGPAYHFDDDAVSHIGNVASEGMGGGN